MNQSVNIKDVAAFHIMEFTIFITIIFSEEFIIQEIRFARQIGMSLVFYNRIAEHGNAVLVGEYVMAKRAGTIRLCLINAAQIIAINVIIDALLYAFAFRHLITANSRILFTINQPGCAINLIVIVFIRQGFSGRAKQVEPVAVNTSGRHTLSVMLIMLPMD